MEHFTSITNIFSALFWLIVILFIGSVIRNINNSKPHYKHFMPNLYAKLFFSLMFAMVYMLYYGGGDTRAYFDGASVLNNVFFENPKMYFKIMWEAPDMNNYTVYFNNQTGYPPSWIYREEEGFFISKIISIFTFFSLKSYLAATFIMAFISSLTSWKLYELIRSYNFSNDRLLIIGVLLLPSVNFWCSGISKDMVVMSATCMTIYHTFKIVSPNHKSSILNWIGLVLFAFLIYQIRDFILIAIAVPLLLAVSVRFVRRLGGGDYMVIFVRSFVFIVGLAFAGGNLIMQSEEEFLESNSFLQEAALIQSDFANNQSYGAKRYDLGTIEFTAVGLARVTPAAILAGIYRPFPWEALSPTLILNGLECLIFFYFTFIFIRRKPLEKIKRIRAHEFLVFSLFFVLIMAFMTGLTSGLFGVLVRLRALLLPFFFIVITFESDRKKNIEESSTKRLTDQI